MANLSFVGANLGNALQEFMVSPDIMPGDEPSYEACKAVLVYHPLGQKMAEAPVHMAQSMPRAISVPDGPEERLKEAFELEWKELQATMHIRNVMKTARAYGIASIIYGAQDVDTDKAVPPESLYKQELYFNVLDPLNTAGSLVLNQDPNAPDFQKRITGIRVGGQQYHPSRSCVILNEEPVYIQYTTSAFGFVGRSVYQRAWFPLKSFVNTMITDDMVARKAGVLIAKMKPAGSIVDRAMQSFAGLKRNLLKEAQTNNVLGITPEEDIETLNLQNIDGAGKFARDNILKNIATAADMPAQLLHNETFVGGFGEGQEDAKAIAQYIDGLRSDMQPLYDYFDKICMYRAWNPDFYAAIQNEFPGEYESVSYESAFYRWKNSFHAEWPSFLKDPPHEQVKTEDIKQKAIIGALEAIMPEIDQPNKARIIQWAAENLNANKIMFTTPLELDYEAIATYEPPAPMVESSPHGESE